MKKKLLLIIPLVIVGAVLYLILRNQSLLPEKNIITFDKPTFRVTEKVQAVIAAPAREIEPIVVNAAGEYVGVDIREDEKDGVTTVTAEPPRSFTPGKHSLKVRYKDREYTQDFTWGVLALNSDKSIYQPGETGQLHFGVLDEKGMMVCDARVQLTITNEQLSIHTVLSTENGAIKVNPECRIKDYVKKPDYEASYQFSKTGKYHIELTATHKNGTYTITDVIEVRESVPFVVQRESNTRIYPVNHYPMKITVTANQNFEGEIVEKVPVDFKLSNLLDADKPFSHVRFDKTGSIAYQSQEIVWSVSLTKGQTYTLGYLYDAPDTSPDFFLTGPLQFLSGSKTVFAEQRPWQIANDDVVTAVEQQVNIINQEYTTTSTSYAPTDNSLGLVEFDGSQYNGESVYFEADLKKTDAEAISGDVGRGNSMNCLSATDCKITVWDATNSNLVFWDCDDTTCSTGTRTILDGPGCVITDCSTSSASNVASAIYCISATDCKIAYASINDLFFIDCDDATCSSGTRSLLGGGAGCTLTGCITVGNIAYSENQISLDCVGGTSDCKITYSNSTYSDLYFADCDDETCSTGTNTLLDGNTGCVLTGCNTSLDAGDHTSLYCISSTDCKIAYFDDTNDDLLFADCDDAACSTGTSTLLDGNSGCGLTGCSTSAATGREMSMKCISATDCKIAYENTTDNALYFADCDDATCSSGTASLVDGNTGCPLTNCQTAVNTGGYTSLDCTGGATDCKIAYNQATYGRIYFADCDNATCTSGTISYLDGFTGSGRAFTGASEYTISYGITVDCSNGVADCKVIYYVSGSSFTDLYFGDCDSAACSSGTATVVDGAGAGSREVGEFIAIDCPSDDDCKIVYKEEGTTSVYNDLLRFMDCDNTDCTSGTITIIEGDDCLITGCLSDNSTVQNVGDHPSIYCVSATDCKISYTIYDDLIYIDCDNSTCSSGTRTVLDGTGSCVLTGCANTNVSHYTQIFCIATDDCKVAYQRGSSSYDLYFADCSNSACTSGTTTHINGGSGCALTDCNTGLTIFTDIGLFCVATDDCKISHYDQTTSSNELWMADCDDAGCTSGSAAIVDGTGCVITNCNDGHILNLGQYNDIDCTGGTGDCKIAYYRSSDVYLADCDNSTCTSGTITHVDGSAGCSVTDCINTSYNIGMFIRIDCTNGATDCKLLYFENSANDRHFVDCDNADCSSGTRTYIDGHASCSLTGCSSSRTMDGSSDLDCSGGSADCKLVYSEQNSSLNPIAVHFADCSASSCSSGTTSVMDDGGEVVWAQLYDSAGNAVSDAIVMATDEAYSRKRTPITLSLSDNTNYTVRLKSSFDSTTATLKAARLIIPQNGASITASETQVELGNNDTTTSTSYGQLTDPKIYNWNDTKFNDVSGVYFEASLKNSGASTSYASLSSSSDCSTTVTDSEVSITGTSWGLDRSADISNNLTRDTDYFICIKTDAGTASIANAKLVIQQSGAIDNMQVVHQLINTAVTDTDSTYTDQDFLNRYTSSNYAGGELNNYYYEATMKTSAGTGYTQLWNDTDGTAISSSELSTTSTSYTRVRTNSSLSLTSAKDYDSQIKNSASNTTTVSNSWLIIEIYTPPVAKFNDVNLDGIHVY